MSGFLTAVIADIVGSRKHVDRPAVQAGIQGAFAEVDEVVVAEQPFRATVGDEFQAVYSSVGAALEATLAARLAMPEGVDCRFGFGYGEVHEVGAGEASIQDGTAWWRAREAIEEAHEREDSRTPSLRGWFVGGPADAALSGTVNAYLLSRDHVVGAMNERARRLAFGTMRGQLQSELAEIEGITQGAVSQALRRSGGMNLLAASAQLRGVL
jgi:hypothetical protein